jgi:hypothetical protein
MRRYQSQPALKQQKQFSAAMTFGGNKSPASSSGEVRLPQGKRLSMNHVAIVIRRAAHAIRAVERSVVGKIVRVGTTTALGAQLILEGDAT